jgi:hypothetical protein
MISEMLPNDAMIPTTQSVGLFRKSAAVLANWLLNELAQTEWNWVKREVRGTSLEAVLKCLTPLADVGVDRYLLVPIAEDWTAALNNAKLGTDLGMIPSLAARKLDCLAIRATAIPDGRESFGATILEVYEPTAEPPLRCRRTISAANDGGRWQFDQFGRPFRFEDTTAYARKRIRDRFPKELLYKYLGHLEVPPITTSLFVARAATMVERRTSV